MLLQLECGHTKKLTGTTGRSTENTWCMHCQERVNIVKRGYKIKCGDCKYTRHFGISDFSARIYAVKHKTVRNHTVELIDPDGDVIETFEANPEQVPLDGEPPF